MVGHSHCPVQTCNYFFYVRHKLIGAGHCVRYTKSIYFKACITYFISFFYILHVSLLFCILHSHMPFFFYVFIIAYHFLILSMVEYSWCDESSDRSFMGGPIELLPTTGVTKAVVCAILSVGWCI